MKKIFFSIVLIVLILFSLGCDDYVIDKDNSDVRLLSPLQLQGYLPYETKIVENIDGRWYIVEFRGVQYLAVVQRSYGMTRNIHLFFYKEKNEDR